MSQRSGKVIFLDIDGVLVTTRSKLAYKKHDQFDITSCRLIDNLCQNTEAKIVISSSWREGRSKENLADILRYNGISKEHLNEDWATPILRDNRLKEIKEWLARHPEVDHWAIIDDDLDFTNEHPRLVLTVYEDGLLFEHIIRLIALLDGNLEKWLQDSGEKSSSTDAKKIEMIKKNLKKVC